MKKPVKVKPVKVNPVTEHQAATFNHMQHKDTVVVKRMIERTGISIGWALSERERLQADLKAANHNLAMLMAERDAMNAVLDSRKLV